MTQRANEEVEAFLLAHPATRFVDAVMFNLNGEAVGKRYPVRDLDKVMASGLFFCPAATLVDVRGVTRDVAGLGFSDGDPDGLARAIPGTLVPVPWASVPTAQFQFSLQDPDGPGGWWSDPRTVLTRVVGTLDELGLRPMVACELEFYLVDATRDASGAVRVPASPHGGRVNDAPRVSSFTKLDEFGDFLAEVDAACAAQGIPVGAASAEYGAGQYEINLHHTDDPVLACDHASSLRRVIKGVARARGLDATFMSKPFEDRAGSGFHVHMSLLDAAGDNVFDERRDGGATRLRQVIGGLRATAYEAMGLFAPNVNAYRRFSPDSFVPANRHWGENNRSVAFRVPRSEPGARRVEHRLAGADANPYLLMAALLAGAHHGLSERVDPGPPVTGNASARADPEMPDTLWLALARMRDAAVLPTYFGRRYWDAYVEVKSTEFESFMKRVFTREYDWYL